MNPLAAALALAVALTLPASSQPATAGPKAGTLIDFNDLDESVLEVRVFKTDGTWSEDVMEPSGLPERLGRYFVVPDDGPCVRELDVAGTRESWTQELDLCVEGKNLGVKKSGKIEWCDQYPCESN